MSIRDKIDSEITSRVAPHIIDSVVEYIERGRPVGDFLQAVIANNLSEALGRADYWNRIHLFYIVQIFYNWAPGGSWGNPEAYAYWVKIGGRAGID